MEHPQDQVKRILGGSESIILTGVGPHTIGTATNGIKGWAITVRTQGSIIAGMTAQDENQAAATAYAPTGVIGTALNQGEYLKFSRAVLTITLTAATDSIVMWTDRPY